MIELKNDHEELNLTSNYILEVIRIKFKKKSCQVSGSIEFKIEKSFAIYRESDGLVTVI